MKANALGRLLPYMRAYRGPFAVAVTTGLIGTLFTIIAPMVLGDITTLLYEGAKDGLWTVRELADGTPDPASVVVYSFGKHLPLGKISAIGGLSTAVLAILLSISVWIGLVAVAMVPATLLVSGPVMKMGAKNFAAHTEQVIQNAMATLMKGRTSFVIAHRLSTIRDANVILYMENGDIKEVGDHDALLARGGKYAELYNSQFG
jgi:ABC-type multidrug transport system fused ATPase/permease subunit